MYKNFHSKSLLANQLIIALLPSVSFTTYTRAKSENHPTASQLNSYFTSILVKELNSDYDRATSNKNSRITVVELEKQNHLTGSLLRAGVTRKPLDGEGNSTRQERMLVKRLTNLCFRTFNVFLTARHEVREEIADSITGSYVNDGGPRATRL